MKTMSRSQPRLLAPRQAVLKPDSGTPQFSRTMMLAVAIFWIAFAGDTVRYTIGWIGYLLVVAVLAVLSAISLRRRHSPVRLQHLPLPLMAFVTWCLASTAWSRYPLETLMGWGAQVVTAYFGLTLALSLTRFQFFRALGFTLRLLVAGSLLFELAIRLWAPWGFIPPAYLYLNELTMLSGAEAPATPQDFPSSLYWSHANLFTTEALQGLPGNRNLLAIIAIMAIVTTAAQLWDHQLPRLYGAISLMLASFTLLHTRSVTAFISLAFVMLAVGLVLLGRHLSRYARWAMYLVVGAVLASGALFVVLNNNEIFAIFNRSSDMSGRGDIWRAVIALGNESPWVGIGWISYWAPWLPEFHNLAVIAGTPYHQAHNSFLDVWMQTGLVGVLLFTMLVVAALIRTWWIAIDRPDAPIVQYTDHRGFHRHAAGQTAIPFLILVALVVQSMTESRLIVEGAWLFLCWSASYAKFRMHTPAFLPRHLHPTRTTEIDVVRDV